MLPEFIETMQKSNNGYKLGLNKAAGRKQTNPDSEAANSEKSTVPSLCYGSPMQQLENRYVWSPYTYPYDGSLYSANNGLYYPTLGTMQVPMQMFPQSYSHEQTVQKFQYFVVIDFEATCDKERNLHPQEIIEFPSVLVNGRTGELEDCFQIYVRPTFNKQLTEFCKELTGINQSQGLVDLASVSFFTKQTMLSIVTVCCGVVSFSIIYFEQGVLILEDGRKERRTRVPQDKGIKLTNFAIVTWSNWDCQVMLESECRFKKIQKPSYFDRWINLKVPFSEVYGWSRYNLKEAVELAGLKWEGRAHCGLDDAKNTARLLTHLMHHGTEFSITNSLFCKSTDHPHAFEQQISSPSEYDFPYQTYSSSTVFQPTQLAKPVEDSLLRCFCGTSSIKFLKPEPKGGSVFYFGCGNWTPTRGARCSFVIPSSEATKTG